MVRRCDFLSLFLLTAVLSWTNFANADVTISYGVNEGGILYIDLVAETANQSVQIFGSGIVADGGADGFELDVQIGDGGGVIGGTDTAPAISSIDLISGTIWESSGPNQTDVEVNPLLRQSIVDTSSLVSMDGLLGTIEFDTRGFGTGEIAFLLTGVANGAADTKLTQGVNSLTTIAPNGVIRITAVPEPSSLFVVIAGLIGMGFHRRRFS
jgi:hypothetical protein